MWLPFSRKVLSVFVCRSLERIRLGPNSRKVVTATVWVRQETKVDKLLGPASLGRRYLSWQASLSYEKTGKNRDAHNSMEDQDSVLARKWDFPWLKGRPKTTARVKRE